MTPDDLRRLSTSPTLFNLDRLIAPRIIKMLYLLGLAAIVMWAITHLFATFAASFGEGLWGLLEIAVFGLFFFVVLRIACEALIVFFRQNQATMDKTAAARSSANIIDDVRDALEELAEDEEEPAAGAKPASTRSASTQGTAASGGKSAGTRRSASKSGSSRTSRTSRSSSSGSSRSRSGS
jgi:uncharacterized membrane protein